MKKLIWFIGNFGVGKTTLLEEVFKEFSNKKREFINLDDKIIYTSSENVCALGKLEGNSMGGCDTILYKKNSIGIIKDTIAYCCRKYDFTLFDFGRWGENFLDYLFEIKNTEIYIFYVFVDYSSNIQRIKKRKIKTLRTNEKEIEQNKRYKNFLRLHIENSKKVKRIFKFLKIFKKKNIKFFVIKNDNIDSAQKKIINAILN